MSVQLSDGSRKINQYRFLRCLGHGTYATVHLGEFTNEEGQLQLVAIKEFDKRRLRKKRHHDLPLHMRRNMRAMDAEDPLYLVRTEVAILKKMSHPHVVQLYEALDDPENDKLFLVFEYCAGGPLCHIEPGRQGERLAEDRARLYFRQILSGVEYMHANGIMHRDIKPDNILMSNELVCKISDFGVSKMIWESGSDLVHQSVGTPAFMSPELCHIGAVESHGYSDDIWALGITLYALLMGRLPFYRDDLFELYEAIQHDQLCLKDCRASPACQDLLRSMLDKAEPNRISVPDMFKHPWVTDHGRDPMPPLTLTDDKAIDQVTEEDLHDAVFRISSMFAVACAVSKFKRAGSRHSRRLLWTALNRMSPLRLIAGSSVWIPHRYRTPRGPLLYPWSCRPWLRWTRFTTLIAKSRRSMYHHQRQSIQTNKYHRGELHAPLLFGAAQLPGLVATHAHVQGCQCPYRAA